MNTGFEDALRTQLHQAVDHVEPPTDLLMRAARRGGMRSVRRRRVFRLAPLVVGVAAAVAVVLTVAPRTPVTGPIAATASEHPIKGLAAKLAASLPAEVQQQIVEGSVANKEASEGRFGFVVLATRSGRVGLSISVLKQSSDLRKYDLVPVMPLTHPTLKGIPADKARFIPRAARARSGTYLVTLTEMWIPDGERRTTADLRTLASRVGTLPLGQATLQKIVDEPGWTVESR